MLIGIIDDEAQERQRLRGYLEQFGGECSCSFQIRKFPSGDHLLADYRPLYDILIFDIDMPGLSGMETARRVRATDPDVVILFVTNIAQYAINGYEVEAVDYIIKPIGYYDFTMKFRRALAKAEKRGGNSIMLDTVEGQKKVLIAELLYVEVLSHYLIFHTASEEFRVRGRMADCEQQLLGYGFCRVHKSYLINLRHLSGLRNGNSEALLGSLAVPVSRSFRDALLQSYLRYLRG